MFREKHSRTKPFFTQSAPSAVPQWIMANLVQALPGTLRRAQRRTRVYYSPPDGRRVDMRRLVRAPPRLLCEYTSRKNTAACFSCIKAVTDKKEEGAEAASEMVKGVPVEIPTCGSRHGPSARSAPRHWPSSVAASCGALAPSTR